MFLKQKHTMDTLLLCCSFPPSKVSKQRYNIQHLHSYLRFLQGSKAQQPSSSPEFLLSQKQFYEGNRFGERLGQGKGGKTIWWMNSPHFDGPHVEEGQEVSADGGRSPCAEPPANSSARDMATTNMTSSVRTRAGRVEITCIWLRWRACERWGARACAAQRQASRAGKREGSSACC